MSLFFEDFGEGPPVVLVHGWPLTHRFWEMQVFPLVESGHRVVTYDRRGFGASSQPWTGYDHETFTADLAALVETLDLTAATLVAFSTGCAEAVRYAAAAPATVTRLVLAAPALYPDPVADDLRTAASRHRISMLDDLLLRYFSVDGLTGLDEQTRLHHLHQASSASPKATVDSLKAWTTATPGEHLARLTVPTLLIQAEADAFLPPEETTSRLAAAVPALEAATIAEAPHGAPLTHHEQWNELLLNFLHP
ncbi:alpha/beta hydrolase [Sphaerisporangium sp. B11E5]|uniref:alpha/beta fold hydrolase n=1 Tax=Sphaerisporangium sp. B11E5 TaxID=3153563 RepID=UPI00325E7710